MNHRMHPVAARELDGAAAWYDAQREGPGAAFLDAYAAKLELLLARPRSGASVPVAGGEVVRKYRFERFPYTVFAVERAEVMVILRGRASAPPARLLAAAVGRRRGVIEVVTRRGFARLVARTDTYAHARLSAADRALALRDADWDADRRTTPQMRQRPPKGGRD